LEDVPGVEPSDTEGTQKLTTTQRGPGGS
jgi:hypothetical protein